MAILTALFAAVVQMTLKFALPHDAIEQFAQSQLFTVSGQIVLMGVAIVETAGVLFQVALMPWASASSSMGNVVRARCSRSCGGDVLLSIRRHNHERRSDRAKARTV